MNDQYCADANVFIDSWNDTYPLRIFPSLWEEIARHKDKIILIKPIYDQIHPEHGQERLDLRAWLIENGFEETPMDGFAERRALFLGKEYEINSRRKGTNINDIKLIAYAETNGKTVVTLEGEQEQVPQKKSNYKIPLICRQIGVPCINVVGMLTAFGIAI